MSNKTLFNKLVILDTTDSTSSTTGALTVAGGVAVQGNANFSNLTVGGVVQPKVQSGTGTLNSGSATVTFPTAFVGTPVVTVTWRPLSTQTAYTMTFYLVSVSNTAFTTAATRITSSSITYPNPSIMRVGSVAANAAPSDPQLFGGSYGVYALGSGAMGTSTSASTTLTTGTGSDTFSWIAVGL